jgi:dTDP-4-dehydrorhamnose reductase
MENRITVLIAGATGQVGNEFRFLSFTHPQFRFIFADSKVLDITKPKQVSDFIKKQTPQYIVNCAAYTAVDRAETEVKKASRVNVNGAKNLAKVCQDLDITLIHLSTDYVYHNNQNTPFKETDKVSPKGIYAKTKLKGDIAALKFNEKTLVLRTSWVYGVYGHNFVKTMLRLAKERTELNVVFDQIGTPTNARDLAKAILHIISDLNKGIVNATEARGIYHYSNEGVTSWYDFARAVFEIRGIACEVKPIESSQYPTPAQRPPFSVLNKGKIKAIFEVKIPHWRDSLVEVLKELP